MFTVNLGDPVTLLILIVIGGIVLAGFGFFLREIGSEAILLAESKKKRREMEEELRKSRDRGDQSRDPRQERK